jgi:hypothetical protein
MRSSNSCGGTEIWVDIGKLLRTWGRVFQPAINFLRVSFQITR